MVSRNINGIIGLFESSWGLRERLKNTLNPMKCIFYTLSVLAPSPSPNFWLHSKALVQNIIIRD
jgi:hypothetical protein